MLKTIKLTLTLGLLSIVAPATAQSFSQCPQHFYQGAAPAFNQSFVQSAGSLHEACFTSFANLIASNGKATIFSAQKLTAARIADAKDESRTDKFYAESRVPSKARAQLEDYKGTGMDRGHLSPAADMPDATSMSQSFSLANMSPQAPQFNRGRWSKIEQDTRKYVSRTQSDVYVITGVVYSSFSPVIPAQNPRIAVGSYWFKLVFTPEKNKAWAFWSANQDEAAMERISYKELVTRTQMHWLKVSDWPSM